MTIQDTRNEYIEVKQDIERLQFQAKIYIDSIKAHELKRDPNTELFEVRHSNGARLTFKLSTAAESFKPGGRDKVRDKYYHLDKDFWNSVSRDGSRRWAQSEKKVVSFGK